MSELQKNNSYKNITSSEFNYKKDGIECPCEKNGGNYGDCRKDGRLKETLNILSECKINGEKEKCSDKIIKNI